MFGTGGEEPLVQLMGVVPAGARSMRAVAVAAVEPRPEQLRAASSQTANFVNEQRMAIETVVFPRQGASVDHREEQLRRREARTAYVRDGCDPERPDPNPPRHARGRL